MQLDIRTIYMMNAVVYLVLHGIIWVSLSRYHSRLVAWWSLWGTVSAAGVVFLGSQGLWPEWMVAVLGQLLMAAGNYGRQYVLRSLNGPVSHRWVWGQALFNVAYLAVNGALFWAGASHLQMMLVFFGFYTLNGLEYLASGRALQRRHGLAGARSLQWSGLVLSGSLAIKLVSLLAGWGAPGLYDPGWDQLVLFAGQVLSISLMNFGLMQILVNQFQQDRARAEHALQAQRERTARAEQETLDLAQVLREREEIIRRLTLSNKTAGMGALMSSIAHEINQPLTTVVLKAELIESYLSDPKYADQARLLCAQLRDDAHRAGGLIRTLRGMFTMGRGNFQKINFADLLRDVTQIVRGHAERMGIDLRLDCPAQVPLEGDLTQLQQVVLNLVNNAIHAVSGMQERAPYIQVDCCLQETWVTLRVKDNGRGIDPELRSDVFALFKSPRARGMGVGLWLSRAVVDSHGGTLDFESTPGVGTVFTLRLPAKEYILGH